jgi:drug/metabolite transporter (DMT)-like permease
MNRSSRSLEAKASHNLDGGPSAAQRRAAIVLLVFLVLMWGCNWPINKTILSYISPLWYACMRLGLGALSLFLAQAFLRVHIKPPSRMDIPIVLSVGIVQMAAVIALMTFGLSIVPAGRSSILSYTMPLWAVPGAILFLGERLQFGKAAALVLGMAGVAFMFNPPHWTGLIIECSLEMVVYCCRQRCGQRQSFISGHIDGWALPSSWHPGKCLSG